MPNKTPDISKLLANDIRLELSEEFDRNFERKAFLDRTWHMQRRKAKDRGRGSRLIQSG